MWKLVGKWLGIPAGVLMATFGAGSWVMAIEAQTKKNEENIAKIEKTQVVMDQRIWTMLMGQLAIQNRMGVTEDDLRKIVEKAEKMNNPAFRKPKQRLNNNGG